MRLSGLISRCAVLVAVAIFSASAVHAQSPDQQDVDPAWQDAITGQIEAFRAGDGAGALEYAGATFKDRFATGEQFYATISRGGYVPLVESRSHTFGAYKLIDADSALQIVEVQGPEQGLYRALYEMRNEEDGWRVQGVILKRMQGVGI